MLHPEHLAAIADARRADDLRAADCRRAHPGPPARGPLARLSVRVGLALVRLGEGLLRRTSSDPGLVGDRPLTVRAPRRA